MGIVSDSLVMLELLLSANNWLLMLLALTKIKIKFEKAPPLQWNCNYYCLSVKNGKNQQKI
jgi:hypothetical protein